jgi:hypothetical protein
MVSSDISSVFAYSILNATIRFFPYPHFLADNVFPEEFYSEILKNMPPDEVFEVISETDRLAGKGLNAEVKPTDNRLITYLNQETVSKFPSEIRPTWASLTDLLYGPEFVNILYQKFEPILRNKYSAQSNISFSTRIQLIRDFTGYAIGPHSDQSKKVAVLIIYLPESTDNIELGTSIYVPKDTNFTCEGGPHYKSNKFDKVFTAPYVPNTALGFLKTDNSFHGVEPVSNVNAKKGRNLIQCSIVEPE